MSRCIQYLPCGPVQEWTLAIEILFHQTFWQLIATFVSGVWLEFSVELIYKVSPSQIQLLSSMCLINASPNTVVTPWFSPKYFSLLVYSLFQLSYFNPFTNLLPHNASELAVSYVVYRQYKHIPTHCCNTSIPSQVLSIPLCSLYQLLIGLWWTESEFLFMAMCVTILDNSATTTYVAMHCQSRCGLICEVSVIRTVCDSQAACVHKWGGVIRHFPHPNFSNQSSIWTYVWNMFQR